MTNGIQTNDVEAMCWTGYSNTRRGQARPTTRSPNGAATCTPAEEQTIFALIDGTPFLSDAVDGDVASYTAVGATIDAGDGTAANAQLNINGDSVWAILFSVKMP